MYRIYGPKFWISAVGYIVLATNFALGVFDDQLSALGLRPSFGLIIFLAQVVIALVFVTPFWRILWSWFPKLNEWIFPDVNGEWDVEVTSNWPRIDRLLKSAAGGEPAIDYRLCKADALPELSTLKMRAKITQSWSCIHIRLWNPSDDTPIDYSNTRLVEPIRGHDGTLPSLSYMFEQQNKTDVVSDDSLFHGAARLEILPGHIEMRGTMWSNRMWRLGMNTAAYLRFTRTV